MVLTLCPDDYEPPKVETPDSKKSPHSLGGGRMLRSKKDNDDDLGPGDAVTKCLEYLNQFPGGDATEVGQKGANLSGGQKARFQVRMQLIGSGIIFAVLTGFVYLRDFLSPGLIGLAFTYALSVYSEDPANLRQLAWFGVSCLEDLMDGIGDCLCGAAQIEIVSANVAVGGKWIVTSKGEISVFNLTALIARYMV
eukprot:jgi/Phyca11/14946/fgenesh1_pg.PHYCAscaffold_10_\